MKTKIIIGFFILILVSVAIFFYFKKNGVGLGEKNVESVGAETLQYKNTVKSFTFKYPKELSFKDTDEGDTTHTIVFSDNISDKGFQIFFTPYYGNQITSSRVLKDIPSGKYTTPVEIVINGSVKAIAFFSTLDEGEMREVWFLHDGYLFQVTAPKELDEWLAKIMETWEFYQGASVGNLSR